ncbi:hypothetical protein F8154_07355 [Alkaliphilus pronyensis]|uniref:Uncharacterized protein n=1 Tax=Alkaliphilus pronyensis TaxID=1482732 RepID=A0A6I0FBW9_9FIRM|nr:hypothetical protein [Alkaliphilus pronyensis]KAB3535250.1 hypothetical protein F8154_07355 [Alkaliphilus pronyensis]
MGTLYGLIQSKQYKNTSKAIRKNNQNEALTVLKGLTLKEKCLYFVKVTKRSTGYQALGIMGLTIITIALDYLFATIG